MQITDLLLLTVAIFFEAGAEPYPGKVEVCKVIVNRVAADGFPGTVSAVIKQKAQFSFVSQRGIKPPPKEVLYSTAWNDSMMAAFQCYRTGPTNGALYYHADSVNPPWARHLQRMYKIGGHTFYKNKSNT